MASIIFSLDTHVINKIAAGEVVQRPASVLKELLDNAVDAGASQIDVELLQSGRSLVRVRDNGCGMSQEDLPLCFERHATSKIKDIQDLERIRTMGFRGEAMASIAAVSQVRVQSKRHEDDHGWRFEVHGGQPQALEPDACANGSTISVQHLFYNVPARRQFLKSDATEFRHLLKIFQQVAMAHVGIGFSLQADQDMVYRLPPQALEERIAALFGDKYRANLIHLGEETSYLSVQGVIADPAFGKKSRGEQFLFVNGRPFQDRLLTYQILKEYEYWKKPDEYPFYALFLQLDPEKVDVNVHPSKMEVKFEDERSVYRLITSVVRKAINSYRHVPEDAWSAAPHPLEGSPSPAQAPDFHFGSQDLTEKDRLPSFNSPEWRPDRAFIPGDAALRIYGSDKPSPDSVEAQNLETEAPSTPSIEQRVIASSLNRDVHAGASTNKASETSRSMWQLHRRYIVTQTASGLSLIDQHAAHKRILFEQALQNLDAAIPGTQQLLFAQTLHFPKSDFLLLEEIQPLLQRIGFSIQLLSGYSCIVTGVPADVEVGDERKVIEGILGEYHQLGAIRDMAPEHRMAVALAEQTAIPRGKSLNQQEMEHIIDRLFSCESPYIDPKGKPTIQVISLDEIEKRFKGLPLR